MLWRSAELLRSRPDVRRPGRVRPDLCRSRGLCPGCRAELLRSRRRRSLVLRSRRRPDLLRSGPGLWRLQQLLQSPEVQEDQPRWLDEQAPLERQEEPLLRSDELLRRGPDVCRPGRVCSDLCRPGRRLLPLS